MAESGSGKSTSTDCVPIGDNTFVRAATLDDVGAMAAIEHAAAGHGRWDEGSFLQELRCAWSHAWVVQPGNGSLVGFFVIWRVADEAHLLNIAVQASCRRRGLGRAMLTYLQTWAKEQGLSKVLLELRQHNGAALRLYESCGFVVNGRRAGYYADTGEDALLMESVL